MLTRNFLELQHGCTGPRRLAYTHSAMNTSRSDSLLVGDRVGSKVKATLFDNGEITGPAGIHLRLPYDRHARGPRRKQRKNRRKDREQERLVGSTRGRAGVSRKRARTESGRIPR